MRGPAAPRLLEGPALPGLAVVRRGDRVLVALAGEEDFDRPLRKAERIDLRIRLADLERRLEESPAAPPDFETAFDAAYDRLAREQRTPFVPLPSLRAALPHVGRDAFDGSLVALCIADRYQLSEHEHPGRLPESERAAALVRDGRAYWFVSRV